jgi:rRNA maturation protein Nop10
MKVCALCRREVEVDKYFTRKSECPHCGGDLHICLSCRFYSETSHNKCKETKAEHQRSRDRANFCEYFEYREGGGRKGGAGDATEEARRKLDDLFGG